MAIPNIESHNRRFQMHETSAITLQTTAFRRAFEQCRGSLRAISLKDFPHGSCGDATDMLGMFLSDAIGVNADYVSGWHNRQSHAWLMHSGLFIDITADQFGKKPVIVTANSEWHNLFEIEIRREPGIDGAAGSHLADLWHDYQMIAATVKKAND
jgi:hypothetical protein